jgi:hypothetical protein
LVREARKETPSEAQRTTPKGGGRPAAAAFDDPSPRPNANSSRPCVPPAEEGTLS